MSELKPCLCGSDKVHFGYEPFCGLTFWRVMCDTCGTQTSTFDTKEEAAKVWNTRPAEDALTAEVERLKAALKDMCELWEAFGKQVPPVLNEQKYLNAKALANAPDTGKMEEN